LASDSGIAGNGTINAWIVNIIDIKQQSSIEARLQELNETPPREIQQDLMVPQSLAAFDRAKIPDQAVLAATHSSESAIPEALHGAKMHRELIPSILDRVIRAGTRQIEGRDERGGCSSHAVGEVSFTYQMKFASQRFDARLFFEVFLALTKTI